MGATLCCTVFAQNTALPAKSLVRPSAVFSFEASPAGSAPAGWFGGPAGTFVVDDKEEHGGQRTVRLERKPDSTGAFSSVAKVIPVDFAGSTLEWRGFLRTEDVSDFAGLWMREDKEGASVEFDNMQARKLKGSTGWTAYSITLPLHPGAQQVVVGALMSGTGKAWVANLELLVDGKPIADVPKAELAKTVLDSDHRFDSASGVTLAALTPTQVDNLVLLGKVWGFLKYYHPQVTEGKLHWDYELLRELPAILAAPDRAAAQAVLVGWIERLGPVEPCRTCVKLEESNLAKRPDVAWIHNRTLLGKDLSLALMYLEMNRHTSQFYVLLMPGVGNPSFDRELSYPKIKLPDAGFQILAAFRFWNTVEYWAPYRDLVGEDWDGALRDALPRIALAKTADDYQRETMALIALVHDTHANLWSSIQVRPPVGDCRLAVNLRFIEDRPVVWSFASTDAAVTAGFKLGDVVSDLDGQPVEKLLDSWQRYYADSNQAARLRDIGRSMTNGTCGPVSVGIRRGAETISVKTQRLPASALTPTPFAHDLAGETFRLLNDQVAYLKLSSVKIADLDHYLELAAKTKGLIVDIRNYPSEFVVFALGSHLVEHPTEFVKFTNGDLATPGAFHWTAPLSIEPAAPHYAGKVVILVDEISQSQAEYTAMALRIAPGAVVIGSQTAGADGNVSTIPLPGGLHTMISGIGVFYPDGRPTQQIGIVPDVKVLPTIEGIRAGRDELLEEGVRQILGTETRAEVIEKMVKP
jgi:C-terminal processing protease CtpA/Prc